MAILVVSGGTGPSFAEAMRKIAPQRDIRVWPEAGALAEIRYALAWKPTAGVLASLPNLEVIVSVGAGVDGLLSDPTLPAIPIARFVDPDLTGRMVDYVVGQTLHHIRRMPEFQDLQRRRAWVALSTPAAHEVRVGLLGLGILGQASARALASLNFQVNGWSRTPRTVAGVTCFSGEAGLDAFLGASDVLVVLLPLTTATRGIVNRRLIGQMSRQGRSADLPGPVLINAGRGGLQVEADILAALDAGALQSASLDVFETEPLPQSSALWSHARVVITPHVAAESTPNAVARYTLDQIGRHERGLAVENLVDRRRGY